MIVTSQIHLALRNRLLGVSGVPTGAYANVDFTPTTGTAYVEEDFEPDTAQLRTVNAQGGITITTGLYAIRYFGPSNADAMTIEAGCDAIVAKFAAGTGLTLSGGDVVVIRGDPAPIAGPVRPARPGWSYSVIRIWWRVASTNVIAA